MKYRSASEVLIFVILSSTGCNQNDLKDLNSAKTSCAFNGTWVACGNDGRNSQRITWSVNESNIDQTIESFNGSLDCTGNGTVDGNFTSTISLGTAGASVRITGATDAVLTPSIDVYACGMGNPTYTSLMFSDSCEEFILADGSPACSAAAASIVLGTLVFSRQ